jgi:hypothetical protein
LSLKLQETQEEIAKLKEKEEALKSGILSFCKWDKNIIGTLSITKTSRTTYNYSEWVKDNNLIIDDKYKKTSESFTFRREK